CALDSSGYLDYW
nr:immunoglobulin heavy chain junction region [Mus musculus]MBK4197639.1 immunoglobulin heavy chain junction region [Mus musculus]